MHYPFERIHLDFFHFRGKTFLILSDAYSKDIEIVLMKNTAILAFLKELNKFFAIFGLPIKMVTDSGPPYNSSVLRKFCESNGIVFMNSPPCHAQSNGLNVQTAKKALIRFCLGAESDLSIIAKIDIFNRCE